MISIPVDSMGSSKDSPSIFPSAVDPILEKHALVVKDFAYVTKPIKEELPGSNVATYILEKE